VAESETPSMEAEAAQSLAAQPRAAQSPTAAPSARAPWELLPEGVWEDIVDRAQGWA